jgi:predicted ArsR family transcriptional regulator
MAWLNPRTINVTLVLWKSGWTVSRPRAGARAIRRPVTASPARSSNAGRQRPLQLAELLHLTPAAVRRHLDHLVAEGMLEARDQRVRGARGRGRPAKIFAITDRGRDEFDQGYDDLALQALRYMAAQGGEDAVAAFARQRVAELEERYRPLLEQTDEKDRSQALALALTGDGYAASVRQAPSGDQMCQHHCPVAHVAAEFPQLCEAETEVFSRPPRPPRPTSRHHRPR